MSREELRARLLEALRCPVCRRYRTGLLAVAATALALWLLG